MTGPLRPLLLLAALVVVGCAGSASPPPAASAPSSVTVLVVGTYHFDAPGADAVSVEVADVTAPERQAEVEAVARALASFRPTRVAVEATPDEAARLDSLYAAYREGRHALAVSEVEQLGFRIAQAAGLGGLDAVDSPGPLPFGPLMAYAEEHDPDRLAQLQETVSRYTAEDDSLQRHATVGGILRFKNTPAYRAEDAAFYADHLPIGAGDGGVGADFVGAWYARNARIAGTVLARARPGDRVLVLFGAAHAAPLEHFFRLARGVEVAPPLRYLP